MKNCILIFSILLVIGSGTTLGQNTPPLTLGDTIPEYVWHTPLSVVNHPNGYDTITLNFYRGTPILIDFWSTWCGSCLSGFPKMESIQEKFRDQLAVLLVNTRPVEDTPIRIKSVFDRITARSGYRLSLPYVLGDTLLTKVFPHRTIPHFVWINKDGVIVATTHTRDVTMGSVADFVYTGSAHVHMKRDIPVGDRHAPLIRQLAGHADGPSVNYSSILTGYIEGISGAGLSELDGFRQRVYRFNTSLAALYNEAFRDERGNLPVNQLVFEVPDSTGFKKTYLNKPDYDGMYCYELIIPIKSRESVRRIMREDLIRHFEVYVKREKRKVKSYSISPSGAGRKLASGFSLEHVGLNHDGKIRSIRRKPISYVIRILNSRVTVPVFETTGSEALIDIEFPDDLADYSPAQLKIWLEQEGLSVSEQVRELEFAVFKSVREDTDFSG